MADFKGALLPWAITSEGDIGCGMVAAESSLSAVALSPTTSTNSPVCSTTGSRPASAKAMLARPHGATPALDALLGLHQARYARPAERELPSYRHTVRQPSKWQSLRRGLYKSARPRLDGPWPRAATVSETSWLRPTSKTARLVAQEEGQVLEDRDLAWLAEGRPEFDAYVADML